MSIHWHAPSPPVTTSIDLRIEAVPLPAKWNEALARPAPAAVRTISLDHASPRVVSIPIVRSTVRVRSFTFPEPTALPTPDADRPGKSVAASHCPSPPAPCCTRIKPPGDIVKLADRLHYLCNRR